MIIAGIDEAGLGPVLGPLVVTAAAVSVPDSLADQSLWTTLAPAVSTKPSRHRRSVAIGDSKKLYHRRGKAPLEHLERAVLGMLAAGGRNPRLLKQLLDIVAPGAGDEMDQYPWYAQDDLPIPHCISPDDAGFSGNTVTVAMDRAGVKLTAVRCEPVLVGQFNRIVRATRNKSTAAFDVTCRLIAYLWQKTSGPMRIYVDRQGGRMRYLSALQRAMPDCAFTIMEETELSSGYVLTGQDRRVEISFSVNCERQHLPVALASMFSKYLRELLMELFNRFWQARQPDLAPTAGYYTDGRRFFAEIQPTMEQMGISKDIVYRCR